MLKKLKNVKSIVIIKSDKGDGVAVLDRIQYDKEIKEIISDEIKFKEISEDSRKFLNSKDSYEH